MSARRCTEMVHRLRMAYYHQLARVELWWGFNVKNCAYFMRIAWMFLCGRLLIITTENSESRGGYKYKSIVLSRRPVSEEHGPDL